MTTKAANEEGLLRLAHGEVHHFDGKEVAAERAEDTEAEHAQAGGAKEHRAAFSRAQARCSTVEPRARRQSASQTLP